MKKFAYDPPGDVLKQYEHRKKVVEEADGEGAVKSEDGLVHVYDLDVFNSQLQLMERLFNYPEMEKVWRSVRSQHNKQTPNEFESIIGPEFDLFLQIHSALQYISPWEKLTPKQRDNKRLEILKKTRELSKLVELYRPFEYLPLYYNDTELLGLRLAVHGYDDLRSYRDSPHYMNKSEYPRFRIELTGIPTIACPDFHELLQRAADDFEKKGVPECKTKKKTKSPELTFLIRCVGDYFYGTYGLYLYNNLAIIAGAVFGVAMLEKTAMQIVNRDQEEE